jgi:Fe-S oxidoreductase
VLWPDTFTDHLSPEVGRAASPSTAVIADGFSCRTQIAHGTPRRATHLAELLAAALEK